MQMFMMGMTGMMSCFGPKQGPPMQVSMSTQLPPMSTQPPPSQSVSTHSQLVPMEDLTTTLTNLCTEGNHVLNQFTQYSQDDNNKMN